MVKCSNCLVNINGDWESFEFDLEIAEHQKFFTSEEIKSYSERYFYGGGRVPSRTKRLVYCLDCSKAIKKLEIKRLGGVKLEPELEDIKANIQSLKDTLDSTLKVNNILLAKLVNLTEENNNFQQQLLNKEVTKTYSLIEQQK
ncbi:MAG: hypothetical protein LBR43_03840 [Spiroplasmataceae bacterium]|nr:hypothetical protein [Spiroplasmataceae bacterium]